jgi:hypothetical protein
MKHLPLDSKYRKMRDKVDSSSSVLSCYILKKEQCLEIWDILLWDIFELAQYGLELNQKKSTSPVWEIQKSQRADSSRPDKETPSSNLGDKRQAGRK